ncbi:hypothetical protein L7F22_037936 [Adiantum nelumboides]|nr:hypothetical protein [Adiantum nelumboides]
MRGTAKILKRLNKDMEELKLHKDGLVPNEEAMAKLETLIQIRKEVLKDMELDIEVHNLDNLGEEAAQLQGQHDTLLWEVEVVIEHLQFVETIINLFKSRMPILPVWLHVHLGSDNSCVQLGDCVACGMSIMQIVVISVYMLRYQHLYHPLCFVTACKSASQCLFHGCEEPLKDALKLLAPGEANMDEHVDTEKDSMEGIFVDGIAHSQAGSSRKPNIDSMCGGCEDKTASLKQASEDTPDQQKAEKRAEKRADVVEAQGDASKESVEVPLKPKPAMNKDVEDAEKPIEKDTTVNLSDEDADLLISDVCGEILGRRKKRSNIEERATPKKKAKVASEPPEPTPGVALIFSPVSPAKWTVVAIEVQEINEMEINSLEGILFKCILKSRIGDVQEPDETVEDIVAKRDAEQDAYVTPDKVEENQEPAVCPKIEEILPNCPGWGYLVLNFCKIKKLIILDLNGLFVKQDVNLFFKPLHHVWNKFLEYDSSRTLLVDDSRYKNMRNVWDNCISPPTFDTLDEDQHPDYLTRTLLPWLCRWALTPNSLEYTKANPISNPKDDLSSLVLEYFVINGDE